MKIMWYVNANRNGTSLKLPCWGGEDEANEVAEALAKHDWYGEWSETIKDFENEPTLTTERLTKDHPHWRANLPEAPKESAAL